MSEGERPLAPEDMEQRLQETLPTALSPEEFAARDGGYGWLDFPFADYRFRDPDLDQWIQSAAAIIRDPARLRACQAQYLSPQEQLFMQRYGGEDPEAVDED